MIGSGEGSSGPGEGWAAVFFDLDGTLADTVELILRCFRHTTRVHLGRELDDRAWLDTMGRPLRDQLQAFARDPEEAARMLETYVDHQRKIHDGLVTAYPGALDVVESLRRRGVPVAVVTSKRREMALRTLASCGLADAWDFLVGGDEVERGKPDPEPVRRALDALGLEAPGRVLFVGDSPWDIRAGRAAGTRTAGVTWGPYARTVLEAEGPDFLVGRAGELLELAP